MVYHISPAHEFGHVVLKHFPGLLLELNLFRYFCRDEKRSVIDLFGVVVLNKFRSQ